jgi:hypothetical protein
LDAGVSPDLSNQFSGTLLMLSASEGDTAIGELLISRGADADKANDFGDAGPFPCSLRRPYSVRRASACPWGFMRVPSARDHTGTLDESFVRPSSRQDSVGFGPHQQRQSGSNRP